MPHFIRFVDAKAREWRVYEFSIIAGDVTYFRVGSGSGQYRGFVPTDGGARRRLLLYTSRGEGSEPITDDLLRSQLARSELDRRDDPKAAASYGKEPERIDPPSAVREKSNGDADDA